jgi:YD repeat-containing protein
MRYNIGMKDQQTFAQFIKVKDFPFVIKDKNGNPIYFEYSNGYWFKSEYDDQGNEIRYENSNGYWNKREYDDEGDEIRYENSDGYWFKSEYDDEGNVIYSEDSDGVIIDERPKQMIELTLEDIAKMKGVDASQIRIKE